MTRMINVTKTYLPPFDEYCEYLKEIWKTGYLTNNGPLSKKLEQEIQEYLGVENLSFVSNGTIALQLALKALDLTEGEIITTPFSFVATVTSIIWEKCIPVFVDIDPEFLTIDYSKIVQAITPKTKAIMGVHVYGNPCNIEMIESIAKKYNLKVIYDAAHAFGAIYNGKSLLSYGDISTCSFHATKVFQTVEGGAVITKNNEINNKIKMLRSFGFMGDDYLYAGINGKNSEIHAAMGLSSIKHLNEAIRLRKHISELYDELLIGLVQKPKKPDNFISNYAYYPVIFKDEQELLLVFSLLNNENIYPRRYFFPSLNELPYLKDKQTCPISENISKRIACLPLYPDLKDDEVLKIYSIIKKAIR